MKSKIKTAIIYTLEKLNYLTVTWVVTHNITPVLMSGHQCYFIHALYYAVKKLHVQFFTPFKPIFSSSIIVID